MNKPKTDTNSLLLESDKLDQLIAEKYTASFMSNTKWQKLMHALFDVEEHLHVSYKTVHSDEVINTAFCTTDLTPFFQEPTLYKEIEWMEIPRFCENLFVANGKVKKKMLEQDLALIKRAMVETGKFNIQVATNYLRIYAYT